MKIKLVKNEYLISVILLTLFCIVLFFLNIGNYQFVDTDETKFVSIAKDMLNANKFVTPQLNGENYFEYPPLIFWFINFFCFIFGKISAGIVRLPVAIISSLTIIFFYLSLKKILTKTYALIITSILALNLSFVVFSHLATNHIFFLAFAMGAIVCSYINIFPARYKKVNKYKNNILMYVFLGLSTMTAGILGFIIPALCIYLIYLFSGNLKELSGKKNIITGGLLLLFIIAPWYVLMIFAHGVPFIKEHLAMLNFFEYGSIRKTCYVLLTAIAGFLPWTPSFIAVLFSKLKDNLSTLQQFLKENSQDKLKEKWQKLKIIDKFIWANTIVFFTGLLFTLFFGAKHSYLIVMLLFPACCITGNYWYQYIFKKKHEKSIFVSGLIMNIIFILFSLFGIFGHRWLDYYINKGLDYFLIPMIIIFFIIPMISTFALILKGRITAFAANLILMGALSFVIVPSFFNFIILNGGENDLIGFATLAKDSGVKLAAYIPSKKYSINYYYDSAVHYNTDNNVEDLREYMKENQEAFVITEINSLLEIENNKINYMLLDNGKRYCIIQYLSGEFIQQEEPEIITF
ncbi:glycosyltransferase family 39 protein [bacterium]|nr:glycosyltransferase family 39 protein [bacterium]